MFHTNESYCTSAVAAINCCPRAYGALVAVVRAVERSLTKPVYMLYYIQFDKEPMLWERYLVSPKKRLKKATY
jgi:hypothetical protein